MSVGDLSPFTSLCVDRLGRQFSLRPGTLAGTLLSRGAIDSFRSRHPTLEAYTCVHPNGTASRLDHIWLVVPLGDPSCILNAAIINDPRHIRDNLIPLVDIGSVTPSVSIPPRPPLAKWSHTRRCMTAASSFDQTKVSVHSQVGSQEH